MSNNPHQPTYFPSMTPAPPSSYNAPSNFTFPSAVPPPVISHLESDHGSSSHASIYHHPHSPQLLPLTSTPFAPPAHFQSLEPSFPAPTSSPPPHYPSSFQEQVHPHYPTSPRDYSSPAKKITFSQQSNLLSPSLSFSASNVNLPLQSNKVIHNSASDLPAQPFLPLPSNSPPEPAQSGPTQFVQSTTSIVDTPHLSYHHVPAPPIQSLEPTSPQATKWMPHQTVSSPNSPPNIFSNPAITSDVPLFDSFNYVVSSPQLSHVGSSPQLYHGPQPSPPQVYQQAVNSPTNGQSSRPSKISTRDFKGRKFPFMPTSPKVPFSLVSETVGDQLPKLFFVKDPSIPALPQFMRESSAKKTSKRSPCLQTNLVKSNSEFNLGPNGSRLSSSQDRRGNIEPSNHAGNDIVCHQKGGANGAQHQFLPSSSGETQPTRQALGIRFVTDSNDGTIELSQTAANDHPWSSNPSANSGSLQQTSSQQFFRSESDSPILAKQGVSKDQVRSTHSTSQPVFNASLETSRLAISEEGPWFQAPPFLGETQRSLNQSSPRENTPMIFASQLGGQQHLNNGTFSFEAKQTSLPSTQLTHSKSPSPQSKFPSLQSKMPAQPFSKSGEKIKFQAVSATPLSNNVEALGAPSWQADPKKPQNKYQQESEQTESSEDSSTQKDSPRSDMESSSDANDNSSERVSKISTNRTNSLADAPTARAEVPGHDFPTNQVAKLKHLSQKHPLSKKGAEATETRQVQPHFANVFKPISPASNSPSPKEPLALIPSPDLPEQSDLHIESGGPELRSPNSDVKQPTQSLPTLTSSSKGLPVQPNSKMVRPVRPVSPIGGQKRSQSPRPRLSRPVSPHKVPPRPLSAIKGPKHSDTTYKQPSRTPKFNSSSMGGKYWPIDGEGEGVPKSGTFFARGPTPKDLENERLLYDQIKYDLGLHFNYYDGVVRGLSTLKMASSSH